MCGCNVNDSHRDHLDEQPRYVRCGCGEPLASKTYGLRDRPLANVYSPLQDWTEIYDLDTAFKRGTVFKQLDFPFEGDVCDGRKGGGCCGR